MFDFMHFLGFMVFNDAMEENDSEPKYSGGSTDDTPFGCVLTGTIVVFAAILGMGYESWGLFFGISAAGIILGALHYHFFDKKNK